MKKNLLSIPHTLRTVMLLLIALLTNTISQAASDVSGASTTSAKNAVTDYLCFTAEEAGSTISFSDDGGTGDVQISTDGLTWSNYTRENTITLKNVGDKIYFKGNYSGADTWDCSSFAMTGKIAASGNVMTLTDGDNPTTSLKGKDYAFCGLFKDCTS